MNSLHYRAAWTDSGFLLTCDDRHSTVGEAAACIPCAGGYVVAIQKGEMRALKPQEEAGFQSIVHSSVTPVPYSRNPPSDSVRRQPVGETLLQFVLWAMSAHGFCFDKESKVRRAASPFNRCTENREAR